MRLEFHQPAVGASASRHSGRRRRLLASLAEAGQQPPIVGSRPISQTVMLMDTAASAALQQLGRDTVETVVWPMGEAKGSCRVVVLWV
jgi:hypothetical protein